LNVDAKLTANDRNKLYLRSVVTQSIAIRNGFGVE
jgi:type IV pilus assembly protein PilW